MSSTDEIALGADRSKELAGFWSTPPGTMAERLQHIEALGQKIADYVRFMGQMVGQDGASGEAKERAVTEFHNRMVVVEKQLARIQEKLRLE